MSTRLVPALLLALIAPLASAQDSSAAGTPAQQASHLKAEAKKLRAQADSTYTAAEQDCYHRFLVNACIDKEKQRRLDTVSEARKLEAEARRIDLAEKQRIATQSPSAQPPKEPAAPSPDLTIQPASEAERIRAERDAAARKAEQEATASRRAADSARSRQRSEAAAEASDRADQAARDRARYEERIRDYEEKKARDAAGR